MNPLDTFLVIISKYFPLDYILLGFIVVYFYFATLSGIVRMGICLLCVNLFKIKAGGSKPQALLIATGILMFSLLALNWEILTLAPQYVTYGSQTYFNANNETVQCGLSAPTSSCTMTQIGTIINRMSAKLNFFGIIFYFATWAFIVCFVLGILIAIFRRRQSNIEELDSDADLEEDRDY